ncbi:MAG TPA: carboxypeptidase-like regulatory domain-containing protein [Terriglobia bacterium]|nr:carboxypeptidase-like regulatory domain-containing protein [Terriglobia bacterium]
MRLTLIALLIVAPAIAGRQSAAPPQRPENASPAAKGSIQGRVLDHTGRPLAGQRVSLARASYTFSRSPDLQVLAPKGIVTDANGAYRLEGVTPGRYLLMAGQGDRRGGADLCLPNASLPNAKGTIRSVVFYPDVLELEKATPITVQPGGSPGGMDIRIRAETHAVRGRVIDARAGIPPPTATVAVFNATPSPGDDVLLMRITDNFSHAAFPRPSLPYNAATGEFVVSACAGSYFAVAKVGDAVAMRHITVSGNDLNDVTLTVGSPVQVSGALTVEGQPNSLAQQAFENARIVLRPSFSGTIADPQPLPMGFGAVSKALSDGTFTLRGVEFGEFRVWVDMVEKASAPKSELYVKTITVDGSDALNTPIIIRPGDAAKTMRIVMSPLNAAVNGIVRNDRNEPVKGARIILAPRQRDRDDLYRSAYSGSDGQFSIDKMAPGEYDVFAWMYDIEKTEFSGRFDPALLRRAESTSQRVRLLENATERLELKLPF